MLKDVGEGKEPSFSRPNPAYFLYFGPRLQDAIELFDTLMVILSKVSGKT